MMKKILLLALVGAMVLTTGCTKTKEHHISQAIGTFEYNGDGHYQFKSYDDAVWWYLSDDEIEFVPEIGRTYTLTYDDNGTTDCTECAEEFECECEVYDDIFLMIK